MEQSEKDEENVQTARGTAREYVQSARTDYSRGTPGRASLGGDEMVMDLAGSKPIMVDSHFTKFKSVTCPEDSHVETETPVQDIATSRSTARSFVTDRTTPMIPDTNRSILNTGRQSRKSRLGSYGLSIITWEEFLECPSGFNELFYLEHGDMITFDPDEVNVFFHDSLMMQPMLGSPSENGKSWTIYIESLSHLKQVRLWMLERVSVITAIINNKKVTSNQAKTAACLVAINPGQTFVREKLESSFEQAWESVLARRKYCIQVDLGSCIEEWCMSAFRMKCKVISTKVFITNGDEYCPPNIETKVWRFACFPCLSVQRVMYKVQRRTNYDDYFVDFNGEPVSICTGSKLMQIYSGGTSGSGGTSVSGGTSSRRPGLKKSVSIKVTTSTQTLNDQPSPSSSRSPVDYMTDDGCDNHAFDGRGEDLESSVISQTPRSNSPPYDHSIPRPRSRMGGHFSARSHISTTRSEKRTRLKALKERSDIHPHNVRDETAESQTTAIIEPVTPINCIQASTEVNYVTQDSNNMKRGVTTVIHGLGGSRLHDLERSTEVQSLVSPGRVQSESKHKITTTIEEPRPQTALPPGSPELSERGSAKVKTKKRIGKLLKEILTNNDSNQVKVATETTNVESLTPGKESKLIVVGNEQCRQESKQTNDMILETVRDMLPPSKENTQSSGFDDAMSSVSEIISPRRDQPKAKPKPKPFLVEPQRNMFFPNPKRNGRVRQAFSDVDQDDDEFTDYEPDSIMSDNIAVNSPRLVAVKKSSKTIAINSVAVISDLDSDLEVFDFDEEENKTSLKTNISSTPRQKVLNPALIRGPRGQRNSRRRYLALNSLRKKTRSVGLQPSVRR
ncbi:hypothetical protein SNE40_020911 [Patella caerulea]|uniref:Uncharacterized protein n=1 Tax=Patella caerulea TaxID=87958 RepID=A0AAN8IXN2_PATCE